MDCIELGMRVLNEQKAFDRWTAKALMGCSEY